MEINPAIVVQSSMALVVAMTTLDVLKTSIAAFEADRPHNALMYRLVAMAIVILIVIVIIKLFSTYGLDGKPKSPVPSGDLDTQLAATQMMSNPVRRYY